MLGALELGKFRFNTDILLDSRAVKDFISFAI